MENRFFNSNMNRILGSLTLVMVILALASWIILNLSSAEQAQHPATITVEGTGEVIAVPDIGTFNFSVDAEGETAEAAQSDSAENMNTILAYLKEAGVAEEDIKTANYNLYPRYRYEERICPSFGYCPPGERVEDGFTVNQTVTVKVRETDKAGELISGVGNNGATNISSLNFTIDDTDSLREEARAKAIEDARQKADVLADSLNVRITGLAGFYENSSPNFGYGGERYMALEEASFDMAVAPELPTGEQTTKVTVSITYEVR